MSYIAFFDLDRTVTSAISGRALARHALSRKMMSRKILIRALLNSFLFRLRLRDQARIVGNMAGWTKGIALSEFMSLCNEVTDYKLIPSVYEEARHEIEFHRNRGARLVLLSSAVGPVCRRIADAAGFDDVLCTELEVKGESLTGRSSGPICFGPEKAVKLKEYCDMHNSTPSECWYYGDSLSDLPALEAAGNPVCINPGRKLKKIASRRTWDTRRWKKIN
ncbi:MAG: HAD-IB family hydrolase [Bacteroidales bacterium]|jgi:putative phosphoserine phosphatase/1-acylglycerol-3-phosphate O-acyltransferase|nr:HAD-IB family hydrolase [Bacteroidales bacterium]MCU0407361.1 HAD-IB family hydrolase [Bacteroidales bacterium]